MQTPSTKTKILNSAKMLFVQNGYAGTSIGAIAKEAKVNHSLIFHHFKNKAQLWSEVKQHISTTSQALSSILPKTSLEFPTFIRLLLKNTIEFYRNNPDLMRLIYWQKIEANNNTELGMTQSRSMQTWLDTFRVYQTRGILPKTLKLEFLITCLLAVANSVAQDNYYFIKEEQDLDEYIEFYSEILLSVSKTHNTLPS